MGAFQYSAVDAHGRTRKGLIEGDTPRSARQALRERGLTPLSLDAVERDTGTGRGTRWRGRISAADLALVTRQLATLVGSGLPIEQALAAVAQQAERRRLGGLLLAVRARVLEGLPLASALGDFPRVFPEMYRATVAAGEQSGHLEVVFERLADYTEARQQMRSKIGLALFYPLLLTVVAIAVVVGLLTFVVPQVVQVFTGIGQQLPALTRALIALSEALQAHGGWMLAVLAASALIVPAAMRQTRWRRRVHSLVLRMPLLGRLSRGINAARFARTFSILLASGVPALDALRIAAQVVANLPMREALERAAVRVREGTGLSAALRESGHFPPMTVQLVASGEASGRLEAMLERAAVQQERETQTLISALLGIFEPALILAMGLAVLLIVLAILLPIFDLNRLVQ